MDLQNGTTRAGSEVWGSVADEFNDRTLNSGGLVYLHHLFQSEGINPEEPNPGMITAQHCYNMFWEVQKAYASSYKNFQASGQHNGHDFWLYSNGRLDVLYMHHWLLKIPRQDLRSFVQTGHEINAGFDAVLPLQLTTPTTIPLLTTITIP
jgi:hypothetical protein